MLNSLVGILSCFLLLFGGWVGNYPTNLDVILEVVGICLSFVFYVGEVYVCRTADRFYRLRHDGPFPGDGFKLCVGINGWEPRYGFVV